MPSADQVPVKSSHSTMRWHKWVVLIAGSTGSALRAVRPPNLYITPVVRRDLVTVQVRPDSYIVHRWPSWPRPSAQSYWQARWLLGGRLFRLRLGGLRCRLLFRLGGCFRLGNGLLGDGVAFSFSHRFLLY